MEQRADLIVRVNGGANAGHTVINEKGEFKLHLTPSGIFNPDAICVLSDTVAVNPLILVDEIATLKAAGVEISNKNLLVSQNAHLVMPWHRKRDNLREVARGFEKIGTTGQGIGSAYSDRTERVGLRVGDLLDPHFEKMFDRELQWQEKLARLMSGQDLLAHIAMDERFTAMTWDEIRAAADKQAQEFFYRRDEILADLYAACETLAPLISNVLPVIWQHHDSGKRILGEAGQGILLDLDRGSYPDVTSSHPGIAGFNLATGLSPHEVDRVIAVTKAYSTRVGEGPLPTELKNNIGDIIREKGHEYGATTGRPRRCGWLDIPAVKYGCRVGGVDSLALTKIDIFDEFSEIKMCIGYRVGNKEYAIAPTGDMAFMKSAVPIYETLPGWECETSGVRNFTDLPENAKKYIERVQELVGRPIELVSVGPEREASIYR
jgi:adenylosuccinate synthase